MKTRYEIKFGEIMNQIGDHAKIVLATYHNEKVSARNMSFIIKNGLFYFQTDRTFRKYHDIKINPIIALCIDNIQIEGFCKELGHPLDHQEFCKQFKTYFLSSYENYSHLEKERLFVIKPTFIQRWNYVNDKPLIEQLYIDKKKYIEKQYLQE